MKQSTFLAPTLRDVPSDAEVTSHQLMLRAGLIRQSTSGVYSLLPLGLKALKKVEAIVREEMNRAGAQEMLMPAIQQSELWKESGRWEAYGPELMRLHDRHGREFALGPTHEEVITTVVRDDVKTYKKLPMTLYQIQTKFRDERRPRFGVLRSREFLMKDAYSFDTSQEGLDESYNKMYEAYTNIFTRCGLDFRAVVADSGAMGGKDTHEFMVLSEIGEDTIAYSDSSSFAANIEIAPVNVEYETTNELLKEKELVNTPEKKSIDEVAEFLQVERQKLIKSILFIVDEKPVLVLVRGDHEVNDIKVKNLFDAQLVSLATEEETKKFLKTIPGYIGPVNIDGTIEVVADHAIGALVNGICGANKEDTHYVNVNMDRDFKVSQFADLRNIQEGDPSPDGKGTIRFKEGIEVGHVFKLGTRYSEAMGAMYLDENGKNKPMIMGCYGIGVTRTLAAIIEQFHDESGIIWPTSVTPFDVHIVPINMKQEEQKQLAEELYNELTEERLEVLIDDRPERPGVKFKDADLYGFPVRVTVGKKANEGVVELKVRKTGETLEVHKKDLLRTMKELLK
ncbi:proline--tRNA ligase [Evansella cellulosilytica]|uniref:Proline--tRNA ligase n=1 Tax=Evansella cellulosilytica (strain ATCC 21833 / DSM 2522 / FERM P-1141 / JCM 9156 / N-4) TaxID=649639 RepID=E6TSS7_EVAC2|nr:proline--tRNA ligase [Evansella cellulosilytica]ADU30719.1 prolyl-tRNA synthetase [Evansella cellulosilytica DSM 2522]